MEERYQNIYDERDKAIQNSDNTYNGLIDQNQQFFNQQKDYLEQYEQSQNAQAQADFERQQDIINKGREEAQKRTDIENQKAYNSYQKLTNPYGIDTENLGGLNNSGYSETFKLGAYNQYQNRRGLANDTLNQAMVDFNNELAEARRTFDVQKAQNSLAKLQSLLEYQKQFNDTNTSLNLGKLENSQTLNNEYNNRYTTERELAQAEKELQEKIRQYNEQMAYQRERDRIADQQWQQQYELSKASTYSGGGSYSSGGSSYYDLSDNSSSGNYQVNTAYYRGNLNADANTYGTFSNGYQPKGISGHGKLKKTGDDITFDTTTLSGQSQTVTQNIWKAEDGTKWYWDGRYNKYIQIK